MNVLVMYSSKTGNTQKLAQEVAKGVEQVDGVTCVLKPCADVVREDFLSSQAIVAGSPVYFGGMSAELKDVFDKFVGIRSRMGDKIGAAFTTSGGEAGGRETTLLSILQAMLIYGMIVMGDPLDASGHYGVSCVGAPDVKTAEDAAKLGKRLAELAKKVRE